MGELTGRVAAITGGVFWLLAADGGQEQRPPVEIVQDGRYGGPDVYEHSRLPDGSFGTSEQQFGSADSLEHQADSGQQSDSADSGEHHPGVPAE